MFCARSSSPSTPWLVYLTYLGKFRFKKGTLTRSSLSILIQIRRQYWHTYDFSSILSGPIGAATHRWMQTDEVARRDRALNLNYFLICLRHQTPQRNCSQDSNWWSTICQKIMEQGVDFDLDSRCPTWLKIVATVCMPHHRYARNTSSFCKDGNTIDGHGCDFVRASGFCERDRFIPCFVMIRHHHPQHKVFRHVNNCGVTTPSTALDVSPLRRLDFRRRGPTHSAAWWADLFLLLLILLFT